MAAMIFEKILALVLLYFGGSAFAGPVPETNVVPQDPAGALARPLTPPVTRRFQNDAPCIASSRQDGFMLVQATQGPCAQPLLDRRTAPHPALRAFLANAALQPSCPTNAALQPSWPLQPILPGQVCNSLAVSNCLAVSYCLSPLPAPFPLPLSLSCVCLH